MHSIRRSCQSALPKSPYAGAYTNGSTRAFSRTCARSRGALPVFVEPSSPQLATLLSTFNSKILLPQHLTKEQEKLVYKKENQAKLEAEPVEITLGEVTLPLQHLNRNQLPNRWSTFREIVNKSETPGDWENLVRILEGFENAGIQLPTTRQELVVRKLNAAGMQHLVLKALQRPKATGLRMHDYRLLLQVLRGVHDMAALSDWEKDETAKALRFAKQIVELLEDSEHCGRAAAEHDFRGRPSVIAVPTEMAAVLADRYGGDVEEVKKYAGRLVAALKQDDYNKTLDTVAQRGALTEADFSSTPKQVDHIVVVVHNLLDLAFIWNALKTSRKVLGTDMPMAQEAQQLESRIATVLTEGVEQVDRLRTRGGKKMVNHLVDYSREVVAKCQ